MGFFYACVQPPSTEASSFQIFSHRCTHIRWNTEQTHSQTRTQKRKGRRTTLTSGTGISHKEMCLIPDFWRSWNLTLRTAGVSFYKQSMRDSIPAMHATNTPGRVLPKKDNKQRAGILPLLHLWLGKGLVGVGVQCHQTDNCCVPQRKTDSNSKASEWRK